MDGKKHRISVEGDSRGERAGFYVGHLDGHPAGYIKNNKTGVELKWKSKGYALDPEEKAKLQAEAANKLAQRAAEQERLHEATIQRIVNQMADLVQVSEPTPYIQDKGIKAHVGTFTDEAGKTTYLPAFDADGKQWTMQYIQQDGTKRFAKDSKKEGCFHPVGGMDALAAAPVLVIAEGYATASTLSEVLGHATVAAFDSGNLKEVATSLHAKYPEKPIVIAGDDDRHLEMTQGVNPGKTKAIEAAHAVGGKAIFPVFAPGENSYPGDLPPITPQSYREHKDALNKLVVSNMNKQIGSAETVSDQEAERHKGSLLSNEQLKALETMKRHTDFNDLAQKSILGREGVERQVGAAISQVKLKADEKHDIARSNRNSEKQEIKREQRRGLKVV